MSLLPLLLVPATYLAPKDWIGDALAAHQRLNSASIKVGVLQVLGSATTRADYDIAYVRPDQLSVRIREPQQGERAASDRTFVLIRDKLFAYDADVHERLTRTIPLQGDIVERLSTALDARFDDAVASLVDPNRLKTFLAPFRQNKGWKTSLGNGLATLTLATGNAKQKGKTTLRFDSVSGLFRGLRIDVPTGRLEWTISYGSRPKAIMYRPPSDAALVSSFTQRRPMAGFSDAQAKAIAERSVRVYDRLRHISFRVEGAGPTQALISGDHVRESSGGIRYVWDRQNAAILDTRKKVFYSGKAGRDTLMSALGALGARMDPVVRQIVTRQNPVRMLLVPGMKVRRAGQVSLDGVKVDLLEFQNPSGRVTMGIRSDNGLLATLKTVLHDASGQKVSETNRSFLYDSVGKPLAKSVFDLSPPGGYRRASLRELVK